MLFALVILCGCTTPQSAMLKNKGNTINILVLGANEKETIYKFKQNESCSIMNLIFKMGKISPYIEMQDVRIIQENEEGNDTEIRIDIKEIMKAGDPQKDIPLKNGDRIVFHPRWIAN